MKATFYKSNLRHLGVNKYATNEILEQNLIKILEKDNPNFNLPTYNTAFFIIDRVDNPTYDEINYIKLELPNKVLYFYVESFDYKENQKYTEFRCNLDYFHSFINDFYNQSTIEKDVLLQFEQATVKQDIYKKTKFLWQNPYLKHLPRDLEIETIKTPWIQNNLGGFTPQIQDSLFDDGKIAEYYNFVEFDMKAQKVSQFKVSNEEASGITNNFLIMYSQKDWTSFDFNLHLPQLIPLAITDDYKIHDITQPLATRTLFSWNQCVNKFSATEQIQMITIPCDSKYIKTSSKFNRRYFNTLTKTDNVCGSYCLTQLDVGDIYENIWDYNLGNIWYKLFINGEVAKSSMDIFENNILFDKEKYHSSLLMYYKFNFFITNNPWTLPAIEFLENYVSETTFSFTDFYINILTQGIGTAININVYTDNPLYKINPYNIYYSQVDLSMPSTSNQWTNYTANYATTSTTSIAIPSANIAKNTAMGVGAGMMMGGPVGALIGAGAGLFSGLESFAQTLFHRSDIKKQENHLNGGNIFTKQLNWNNLLCEIDSLSIPDLEKANYYFNYFGNIVSQPLTLSEWFSDKSTNQVNYLKINNIEQAFSFITTNEVKEYFKNLFANGVRIWEKKIKII